VAPAAPEKIRARFSLLRRFKIPSSSHQETLMEARKRMEWHYEPATLASMRLSLGLTIAFQPRLSPVQA